MTIFRGGRASATTRLPFGQNFGILFPVSGIFHPGKAWGWAALLLLAIPAAAQAQFTSGDYSYTIEYIYIDPTGVPITITGYSGPGGAVTIPDILAGHPVEKIHYAFAGCLTLTSVRTPDSGFFRTIGGAAFAGCSNLTNVVLSGPVTGFGDWAFYGCARLTNIELRTSSIGTEAFARSGLRNVAIGRYTTQIGAGAFSDCADLTAITVESNNAAFFSTNGVLFYKEITQSGWTDRIELFQYPAGKQGAYSIPEGVVRVQARALSGCRNLTGIAFGNSITDIGHHAFTGCSGLTEFELPDNIVSVGHYAFESCTGATNVWIGTGVTNMGYNVFENCVSLTRVYFSGNAPGLSGSVLFNGATNATIYRLPGASGWPPVPELWAGRPTALWLPETKADESLGVQEGRFGFNINWASGQTIVVEACTNLADPVWLPVGTNIFNGDSTYFGDSEWANLPGRFYRLCKP